MIARRFCGRAELLEIVAGMFPVMVVRFSNRWYPLRTQQAGRSNSFLLEDCVVERTPHRLSASPIRFVPVHLLEIYERWFRIPVPLAKSVRPQLPPSALHPPAPAYWVPFALCWAPGVP